MALLGRSHQGRPEVGDTLMMVSHGVEISIAGGGANEKDERGRVGVVFIYILLTLYIWPAESPRGRTIRECDLGCTAMS